MTIRLTQSAPHIHPNSGEISLGTLGPVVARADTPIEAEQAKRAFETVLAPRFTRNEAIAIVQKAMCEELERVTRTTTTAAFKAGVRLALEALAAAGVFVDGRNMAEKLDAAGIR